MTGLTHLDREGRARMVDVGEKAPTSRTAEAIGHLRCAPETLIAVKHGKTPKGSVASTAELAGIMGAKRTADLIPLCHPLPLSSVVVEAVIDESLPGFTVKATTRCEGKTGVEMEALTAVSIAALTLFDMLKAIDRTMQIEGVRVISKTGGKSGSWQDR
ncbi:cyclic pyranopterin monophosphate synthase MoaC [Qipengyuania gaetbuli]|uniref:cyclic pyranopterin monophosphate synthase MoaC n=1 Tax=Qipengyuania gaetbuli TaxID=266952 RepID=UPI001CFEEFAC|nr:cyclic pyranopterin monophosphate synthase MoaC [Qipengyuania gaetbuli]